ncbi:MAG TPA: hypothetical protein PLP42_11340 [Acidobacteriota bacterium]|nr:hypothetical protein [Acidobacteriota bacterium]
MRYLVRARVKQGKALALLRAIKDRVLGRGSIAGDEYLRDMENARQDENGQVSWIEVCYCPTPLEEERPYWEEYFELSRIKDAHSRRRCKDWNGSSPWACSECDCTARLEARMESWGKPFLLELEKTFGD